MDDPIVIFWLIVIAAVLALHIILRSLADD